jgi:predicted N-acetyltransferase YhbS
MQIRPERPDDIDAVRSLTTAAFNEMVYSSQTEAAIVEDQLQTCFLLVFRNKVPKACN